MSILPKNVRQAQQNNHGKHFHKSRLSYTSCWTGSSTWWIQNVSMFRGPLKMLKPCNPKPFCLCLQGFASTLQIIRLECVASGVKHVTLQLEYAQLQLHYQGIFSYGGKFNDPKNCSRYMTSAKAH